ncbi:IPT/TIG domain-containing protein [Myxococcota bacterium]|nr:IPT/TIG domain-containing protein [Myxococcota bacterium]
MKSPMLLTILLGLTLPACQIGSGLEDYYDGAGPAPEISGLDVASVPGNVGGQTVVISGSGFGDDPAAVTVVFGNVNAEILSVEDGALTVTVPQGPIQGGAVDLAVGTAGGQVILADGFTYDLGDVYEDQTAYIVVNNDWFSCYGGVGYGAGCETFAWVGLTGISARGEFMEDMPFPRQHGQFVGYWGGAQVAMGEWHVGLPPYNSISLDIESAVEDLRRKDITEFTLRNAEWQDEQYCANISTMASYAYGGGDPVDPSDPSQGVLAPQTVAYTDLQLWEEAPKDGDACEDPQDRLYNLGELRFCETYYDREANQAAYERAGTWVYQADWPVGESFFVAEGSGGDASDEGVVKVTLDVPEAGISNVGLTLHPYTYFEATAGLNGWSGDPAAWAIGDMDACPDGNGDGNSTLDEAAFRMEWLPADLGDVVGGAVKGVDTHVRMTIDSFNLGWYGGEGFNMQASIVVPDAWNVDPDTGKSVLELPAEVLLQFPSLTAQIGEVSNPLGGTTFVWGDPINGTYGYFLVTMERVTEYRIEAPELNGDLVFAYVTGDFGFYDYVNPLDSTEGCGDCQDNDGDGWADAKDPDCDGGKVEDNSTFGSTTCNDGLDNDGDGDVDAQDEDCEDGLDGETNCSDGIDNDGDGLEDGEDGECGPSGSGVELGEDDPAWQCQDGADNDGDTWVDFDDPDCGNGADDELGLGSTQCNDGLDNDGHGDVDSADLACVMRGATYDAEAPTRSGDCDDATDNDGDGYLDGMDPDCEIQPYNTERYSSAQSGWGGWTTQCYNQVDDDGNGDVDVADPGCALGGEPDGFLDDESAG